MLAIAFVLLEQATSTTTNTTAATDTTTTTFVTATGSIDNKPVTMSRNTTSLDSNKVSQKRNSAEHISEDPLTKDVPSTVIYKLKPQQGKLRPVTNTENEEASCSVSPESTSSVVGNTDKQNTYQNISKENLPIPHIPPASEQFVMHSEESTDIAGNFQSNTQNNDSRFYCLLIICY